MKKNLSLVLLAFGLLSESKSQVVLTENFTAPFSVTTPNSWVVQNNSTPTSSINWFQGNTNSFGAFNGAANDYFASNFNATNATSGPGTISNWLISPVVTMVNGATIEFATRTINTATVFPDRLQVQVIGTPTYNIPNGSSSVGGFINVFDVNASLSTATNAVQNGSVVTGYPQNWTVYTATVTGITGTVTGRFAFRYFVTNAGSTGANSNYVGLDAVKYTLPCDKPVLSVTSTNTTGICSGASVGLSASSGSLNPAISYSWSSGGTTSSVNVSPSATTIYTVSGTNSVGCIGTQTAVVDVTVTPNIISPSYTICSNSSATLIAKGAAISYTWDNSNVSFSIAVSPTATTVYTVSGSTQTNGACPGVQTVTVTLGSQLSMEISATSTNVCAGKVVTLSAISAASTYSWDNGSTVPTITVSPASNTTYSVAGVSVSGTNICVGANTISIVVDANPTLTVSQPTAVCSSANFTLSASGASTYDFMLGTFTSTDNPATFAAPFTTTATTTQYSVTGTATNGCKSSGVYTMNLNANPVISIAASKLVECINSSVTLTASGASSYTWSGATGTNPVLVYPTGATATNKSFTATGLAAATGCSGSSEITIQISDCVGIISNMNSVSEFRAYPNPFSGELILSGQEGTIELVNLLGEVVLKSEINSNTVLNTESLTKGVYILKVFNNSGEELKSKKLIKH